jgi:glutathione S-transferase
MKKVTGGLDWLEANGASIGSAGASEVDLGQIAVACALGYLDFRFADTDWRKARPRLSGWFMEFSQRASMQRTMPSA